MKFSKRKMMAIAAASMVALAPMTAKADKNGVSIKSDSLFQLAQYNFYAFKGVYGDRLFYTRLYKNGSMEEIEKFFRDPDNLDLCETSQQEDVRSWRFQCREKESDQADPSRGAEPERPEVSGQLLHLSHRPGPAGEAGSDDRPAGGAGAGDPDPEPAAEEPPLSHRRARRRQNRHRRGTGSANCLRPGALQAPGQAGTSAGSDLPGGRDPVPGPV